MVLGAGAYAMAAMGGGPNQSGVCVGRAEVCGAGSEVRRLLRGSCTLWPRGSRPWAVVLLDLVLCEQAKGPSTSLPAYSKLSGGGARTQPVFGVLVVGSH